MRYDPTERWYAIRVRYKHEEVAKKALSSKNFSPLYLTYQEKSIRKDRIKILTKPFFGGYMFIKAKLSAETHVEVLKSQGVVEILKNTQGPIPIPDQQINNISILKDFQGKSLPMPKFTKGNLVKVIKGALEGLIGRIDELDKDWVKISVDNMPTCVGISLAPELLKPLHPENPKYQWFSK